jgi:hypothetical protein
VKLTGKIVKSFLFLWAAAILWIYIGSLVNFHQHKIWGRPLLPQLLYAKRDKEQSIDFCKLLNPDFPKDINPGNFDNFSGISSSSANGNYYLTSFLTIISAYRPAVTERFISSNGLRAPPLS